VTAAAANHSLPLALNQNYGKPTIVADGQSTDEQRRNPFVNVQIVSPNYFRTMGIPLLSGRSLTADDRLSTQRVAVLSRPLAERLFGATSALGRQVRMRELLSSLNDKGQEWFTVIGVAEGVRSESLTSGPGMDLYLSNQQQFAGDTFFILRTAERPDVIGRLAREAIRQVDPDQPIFGLQTVDEVVEETVWQRRIAGHLSLCFGAMALLLAAVGTYSLLSWIVGQRKRELAVRQAVGCTPAAIRGLILGEGLRLAFAGMVGGLLIAIPLAYAFSRLLFGVSPSDPSVIAGAVGFTLVLAVFASAIPASRAARVNANDALKAD
jgi:ABC-type antimicrobial peptide transport system permease subunit